MLLDALYEIVDIRGHSHFYDQQLKSRRCQPDQKRHESVDGQLRGYLQTHHNLVHVRDGPQRLARSVERKVGRHRERLIQHDRTHEEGEHTHVVRSDAKTVKVGTLVDIFALNDRFFVRPE